MRSSRTIFDYSDPEILAAIELAFDDAWTVLAKRKLLSGPINHSELRADLNQRLAILVSGGVTDTDELARQVLVSFSTA
jgi:hypothetical protein